MIAMTRAQLAPALLLLLILLAAAAPLVPALNPLQEIRDRKINGLNKPYNMGADPAPADAYAGGEKKPAAPESPKEAVAQKPSYVKGAGTELKSESRGEEKVLETKINAEVKQMKKEAAYDDAMAEMKAKELKSKPKNTTDDAEEKKSKGKADYSSEVADEKEEKKEKKEKKKKDDDDSKEENKAKSKSEDGVDDEKKKEKKPKIKDDDDDEKKEKKEKKSKSKEEEGDVEKKSSKTKSGGGAYEVPAGVGEKKLKEKSESSEEKKKEFKSKNKQEDDFDAVPVETKADESMPATYTPAAPAKKTPTPYQAPMVTTMSASESPDGYVAAPAKAVPATMVPASDSPDGYAAPTTTTMSASDSPDGGDIPAASYSPDGSVTPAVSDSPDGYSEPSSSSKKVNVQSFEEYVPKPVLDMLSPTVKSLCAKTRFPYRCETSIAKLPETTVVPVRQKDGLGVLTLAVDAVRAKIAEAKNVAKDIAVDPRTDKVSRSAISDCMAMYDDIGTSYDTGMAALKRGDRATAATAFDAARTFVDTCDQGFHDLHRGEKPSMAGDEKVLAELSSNVLAINRYAQPGGGGTY